MEFEEFTKEVMSKLPAIPEERDYTATESGCRRLYEDGFTVNQAVRFCLCTEEVDHDLDEDIALKRMHNIYEEVSKNPVTGRFIK